MVVGKIGRCFCKEEGDFFCESCNEFFCKKHTIAADGIVGCPNCSEVVELRKIIKEEDNKESLRMDI